MIRLHQRRIEVLTFVQASSVAQPAQQRTKWSRKLCPWSRKLCRQWRDIAYIFHNTKSDDALLLHSSASCAKVTVACSKAYSAKRLLCAAAACMHDCCPCCVTDQPIHVLPHALEIKQLASLRHFACKPIVDTRQVMGSSEELHDLQGRFAVRYLWLHAREVYST